MIVPRIISAFTFVLCLLVWELAARYGFIAEYILPSPSSIVGEIISSKQLLATHAVVTATEIILGFALALVLGVLFAALMVWFSPIEPIIYPWLIVSQVIPKVAIAPLLLMWLGFGLLPKVIVAFSVAFFPIVVDTMVGLRSVERDPIFLLRSMGAGPLAVFWHVRMPTALPHLFAGMKVAITLAAVGAIVGEFVGSNTGLGYLLLFANGNVDSKLLFASLTVISLLALLLYWFVSALERALLGWHVSHRVAH